MSLLYLIKIGEIALKKGNRDFFERKLRDNIITKLGVSSESVSIRNGRFYVRTDESEAPLMENKLSQVFGIIGYSRAFETKKEWDSIKRRAIETVKDVMAHNCGTTFKVNSRRTDKSFPLDSYKIASELGTLILENFSGLKVDVKNPDWLLNVEIREKAYLYGLEKKGPGGLPVGTAGKGLLLLSGGIDSPVAGYMMAKRGINLSAVHFHTPPYTSDESLEKVRSLASVLSDWNIGLKLYTVPFTNIQLKINKNVPRDKTTLHTRACMMKAAELIATKTEAGCLITGESLSQVASQTMQSLRYTNNSVDLPVFRPLIGFDKEDIVTMAQRIGSFDISIKPFEDCCALFSPEHPSVRPDFDETAKEFDNIPGILEDIAQSVSDTEIRKF